MSGSALSRIGQGDSTGADDWEGFSTPALGRLSRGSLLVKFWIFEERKRIFQSFEETLEE